MNKRQGNKPLDLDLAHKGMIPWSTKEFYWTWARYAEKKYDPKNKGVDDLELFAEVFQKRYPNELASAAHLYRLQLIRAFIFKNGRQLVKDGFAAPNGEPGLCNELMDILCTVPFSEEKTDKNGEKSYNFSYSQVKNEAQKKLNARLN